VAGVAVLVLGMSVVRARHHRRQRAVHS
jgi:hypothetical protein